MDVVLLLLTHPKLDVNELESPKPSPLSQAAKKGDFKVVKTLLAHPNINLEYKDEIKRSPLYFATNGSYSEIVALLLLTRPRYNMEEIELVIKNTFITCGRFYDFHHLGLLVKFLLLPAVF